MRINQLILLSAMVISLSLGVSVDAQDSQEQSSSPAACDTICALPEGDWASIPWELDLLEAQRKSIAASKPLFIWSMDGHPLACT